MKYFEFRDTSRKEKGITCAVGYPVEFFCSSIMNARLNRGEFVSSAAVRLKDGQIVVATRPGKHKDIMEFVNYYKLDISETMGVGFITTAGRYISKQTALNLAVQSKQLSKEDNLSGELQCEDLW